MENYVFLLRAHEWFNLETKLLNSLIRNTSIALAHYKTLMLWLNFLNKLVKIKIVEAQAAKNKTLAYSFVYHLTQPSALVHKDKYKVFLYMLSLRYTCIATTIVHSNISIIVFYYCMMLVTFDQNRLKSTKAKHEQAAAGASFEHHMRIFHKIKIHWSF